MQLNITAIPGQNQNAQTIDLADAIFDRKFNEALIHQVVTAYQAGGRSGNRAQKGRSEVRGGGRKPFRQKGTGQARAGTIRSPLWRGGGKTFPAKPKSFAQKVNKKMYSGAISSILSELVRQERLLVVEDFNVASNKTKELLQKLGQLNLNQVLIVTENVEPNLYLAARNLPQVDVIDSKGINPVSLIGFDKVLFTVSALKKVEETLA